MARSGGAKRHRKVLRDSIQGIKRAAIRRLCRRGGIKRISGLMYEEVREMIKSWLQKILADAVIYMEHNRKKTISVYDVVYALNRNGQKLYGADKDTVYPKKSKARKSKSGGGGGGGGGGKPSPPAVGGKGKGKGKSLVKQAIESPAQSPAQSPVAAQSDAYNQPLPSAP